MKTEMILYRQQIVSNPKFSKVVEYGWVIVGSTWVKQDASIRKTNTVAGTISQTNLLTQGVTYQLKFTLSGRTTGTLTITNKSSGTVHQTATTNQMYTVDFVADGEDIIFNASTTFNGTISNVSLYQTPISFNIDLDEDVIVPMNFNIDNIFKVNTRKTAFSKSIITPGTDNNNKAYNHIYKINGESLFNPNIRSRVVIKNDGISLFDGSLALNSISKSIRNKIEKIRYSVSVTGNVISFFDKLGDLTIRDLDFSDYDHVFGIERAIASWNDDITINGAPGNSNTTTTYTSPSITGEANVVVDGLNRVEITFSAPHAFLAGDEVYVDSNPMLGYKTYSFDQTVLSVPSSTRIILDCYSISPFSGSSLGTVKKKQLSGFGYWYPCVDYGTYMKNHYASGFLGGTGLLEIGRTYIIKKFTAGDDFINVGAVSNTDGEIFQATGTTPTLWSGGTVLTTFRDMSLTDDTIMSKYGDSVTNIFGSTDQYWEAHDFVPHIFLREVFIKILQIMDCDYTGDIIDSKLFRRLIIPMNQTYSNVGLPEGNTLIMNDWLPNIKLIDVFNSVLNMFNLGVVSDKDDGRLIEFVNRSDFYTNSLKDWTGKLVGDEEFTIQMMNSGFPKIYHFKGKDSKDFLNTDYNLDWGDQNNSNGVSNAVDRKYGDFVYSLRSDYLTDTNKVETIFEPSVMNNINAVGSLFTASCYVADGDGANIKRDPLNKILVAGVRLGTFSMVSENFPADNMMFSTIYPYAGHMDNHFQPRPTHDINFGKPLGVYFTPSTSVVPSRLNDSDWDVNCLFNKYWRRYIESISDSHSKIVKGYFKLNVLDIYELDFRERIKVGDLTLKLYKIVDWDINGSGICMVEFLASK